MQPGKPVIADGEIEHGDPEYPERHETAEDDPGENEESPAGEEFVGVGAGLVDLAEDGKEDADKGAGGQEEELAEKAVEAAPTGADEGECDSPGGQPEFARVGEMAPVVGEEADDAGEDEGGAEAEEAAIEPGAPRQLAAQAGLELASSAGARSPAAKSRRRTGMEAGRSSGDVAGFMGLSFHQMVLCQTIFEELSRTGRAPRLGLMRLRNWLVLMFSLLLAFATGLVGWLGFSSSRNTIKRYATADFAQANAFVTHHVLDFLDDPANRLLNELTLRARRGMLNMGNDQALGDDLGERLRVNPSLAWISYSDAKSGHFTGVRRSRRGT